MGSIIIKLCPELDPDKKQKNWRTIEVKKKKIIGCIYNMIYRCKRCNRTVNSVEPVVYCKTCKGVMERRNTCGIPIDKRDRPDLLRMQHDIHK